MVTKHSETSGMIPDSPNRVTTETSRGASWGWRKSRMGKRWWASVVLRPATAVGAGVCITYFKFLKGNPRRMFSLLEESRACVSSGINWRFWKAYWTHKGWTVLDALVHGLESFFRNEALIPSAAGGELFASCSAFSWASSQELPLAEGGYLTQVYTPFWSAGI